MLIISSFDAAKTLGVYFVPPKNPSYAGLAHNVINGKVNTLYQRELRTV